MCAVHEELVRQQAERVWADGYGWPGRARAAVEADQAGDGVSAEWGAR